MWYVDLYDAPSGARLGEGRGSAAKPGQPAAGGNPRLPRKEECVSLVSMILRADENDGWHDPPSFFTLVFKIVPAPDVTALWGRGDRAPVTSVAALPGPAVAPRSGVLLRWGAAPPPLSPGE